MCEGYDPTRQTNDKQYSQENRELGQIETSDSSNFFRTKTHI